MNPFPKKVTAWLALFVFSWSQFPGQGFSFPASSLPIEVEAASAFSLEIPSDLGSIQNIFSGSGPAVIHIQEAHGNYEGQKKIEALLDYLKKKYGVDLVLLEGSAFPLHSELARFDPVNEKLNREILDRLVQKSYGGGAELFLAKEKSAAGFGIENLEAYNQNSQAFVEVLRQREKSNRFLEALDVQMRRLAGSHLNKRLRHFMRHRERVEHGILSLSEWLSMLQKSAREILEVDLSNPWSQVEWPMLVRLARLKEFEGRMDAGALEREKKNFLKTFKNVNRESWIVNRKMSDLRSTNHDPRFTLSSRIEHLFSAPVSQTLLPASDTELLFEQMLSHLPRDFNFKSYPNLELLIGSLLLQSELKPDVLQEEMNRMAQQITDKLIRNDAERRIAQLLRGYWLLKKLFALELTAEEYDQIRNSKSEIRNKSEIDALFKKALEFYRLAKVRDQFMLANIEARLKASGKSKAVVITGGFHAQPFQAYFKERGYNYALVSPKLETPASRENYVESILENYQPSTRQQRQATMRDIPYPLTRRSEMTALHRNPNLFAAQLESIFQSLAPYWDKATRSGAAFPWSRRSELRNDVALLAPALTPEEFQGLNLQAGRYENKVAARGRFFSNLRILLNYFRGRHHITQQQLANFISVHLIEAGRKAHAGMITHQLQRKHMSRENALRTATFYLQNTYSDEPAEKLLARMTGDENLAAEKLEEIFPYESGRKPLRKGASKEGAVEKKAGPKPGWPRPSEKYDGPAMTDAVPLPPREQVMGAIEPLGEWFDPEAITRESAKRARIHLNHNADRVRRILKLTYTNVSRATGINIGTLYYFAHGKHEGEPNYEPPTSISREYAKRYARVLLSPYFMDSDSVLVARLLGMPGLSEEQIAKIFPTEKSRTGKSERSELRAPMKILLADLPGKMDGIEALAQKYPEEVQIIAEKGIGTDLAKLEEVITRESPDVVFVRSTTKVFNHKEQKLKFLKLLNPPGRLKQVVILRGGADTDNIDLALARELGIVVARTHGNQNSVANLFFRFLFSYLNILNPHQFNEWVQDLSELPQWSEVVDLEPSQFLEAIKQSAKRGKANEEEFLFRKVGVIEPDFRNLHLGLAGFGTIPREIIRRLQNIRQINGLVKRVSDGLPMPPVLVWSRSLEDPSRDGGASQRLAQDLHVATASKEDIFEEANVISLHLPGSSGVFLGKEEFKKIVGSPGPIAIINTSRQALIDHDELFDAMSVKRDLYYFADLDLIKDGKSIEILEKLRKEFSNRVFLTPHIGASTDDAVQGVEENTIASFKELREVFQARKELSQAKVQFVVPPPAAVPTSLESQNRSELRLAGMPVLDHEETVLIEGPRHLVLPLDIMKRGAPVVRHILSRFVDASGRALQQENFSLSEAINERLFRFETFNRVLQAQDEPDTPQLVVNHIKALPDFAELAAFILYVARKPSLTHVLLIEEIPGSEHLLGELERYTKNHLGLELKAVKNFKVMIVPSSKDVQPRLNDLIRDWKTAAFVSSNRELAGRLGYLARNRRLVRIHSGAGDSMTAALLTGELLRHEYKLEAFLSGIHRADELSQDSFSALLADDFRRFAKLLASA